MVPSHFGHIPPTVPSEAEPGSRFRKRQATIPIRESEPFVSLVTDKQDILRVMNLYVEGSAKGDPMQLDEAFHDDARWFGYMNNQSYDMRKPDFIELMVKQPADTGGLDSDIVAIQQVGNAASVQVNDSGWWGDMSFTNFFQLVKFGSSWKIVSKAFHLHE